MRRWNLGSAISDSRKRLATLASCGSQGCRLCAGRGGDGGNRSMGLVESSGTACSRRKLPLEIDTRWQTAPGLDAGTGDSDHRSLGPEVMIPRHWKRIYESGALLTEVAPPRCKPSSRRTKRAVLKIAQQERRAIAGAPRSSSQRGVCSTSPVMPLFARRSGLRTPRDRGRRRNELRMGFETKYSRVRLCGSVSLLRHGDAR